MKIGQSEGDALGKEILLHTAIQLPAFFRLEIGIAERRAAESGRKKQLVQCRRLEPLGITRFQLSTGFAEQVRGGKRRCPGGAEALVVVETNAGNQNQPLVEKLKLLLQVVAHVADRLVDAAAGVRRAKLIFDPESRRAPVVEAVIGLQLAGVDARPKKIPRARVTGKTEKHA